MPTYLKVGFSFFMALIIVNTMTLKVPAYDENLLMYTALIAKEFIVGLTIGFIAYLIFTAVYVAGEIIDMQIGFGVVNVLDPMSNIQVPISSNLYFIISMLVFLAVNGHHVLIKALYDSFNTVPLGSAVFGVGLTDLLLGIFTNLFFIGFKIAAPIVAAILVTDVALGTISRMVPQLNVFVIGMPLKIFVGIVVMIVTIPMFMFVLESIFNLMSSNVSDYIKGIAPK